MEQRSPYGQLIDALDANPEKGWYHGHKPGPWAEQLHGIRSVLCAAYAFGWTKLATLAPWPTEQPAPQPVEEDEVPNFVLDLGEW